MLQDHEILSVKVYKQKPDVCISQNFLKPYLEAQNM